MGIKNIYIKNIHFFLFFILFFPPPLPAQTLVYREAAVSDSATIRKQYFQSDSIITYCFSELKKIDPSNADMIIVYGFYLGDVEKIIHRIDNYELPLKLDLSKSDPIQFNDRFTFLFRETNRLSAIISQQKANLDYVFYRKGMEKRADSSYTQAAEYFKKSLKVNKDYAPSIYQLSKLQLETGQVVEAGNTLKGSYPAAAADTMYRELAVKLAGKIEQAYLTEAGKLNEKENFLQSIALLEHAFDFCTIPCLNNCDEVKQAMTDAKYGIYNSYLQVASKALERYKLTLVESFVAEATKFQEENKTYIPENLQAVKIIEATATIYIDNGKILNKEKKYKTALDYFNKAAELYSQYGIIRSSELIEGMNTANTGLYELMVKNTAATSVTTPDGSNLPPTQQITTVVPDAVVNDLSEIRKQVFDALRSGSLKAWGNDLEGATGLLQLATTLQKKYNLISDPEVVNGIAIVQKKIRERQCLNAQEEYDRSVEKAKRKIKETDYLEAERLLIHALAQSGAADSCVVDTANASSLHKQYLRPVTYQIFLSEASDKLFLKDYDACIDNYSKAGIYFFLNNVSDYGLTYQPLYKYVLKQNNQELLMKAASYLSGKNQLNDALVLLNQLKLDGVTEDASQDIQEKAGAALAARDFKNNPAGDAKQNVISYTNNDKWYRFLKIAYLKNWGK